MADDPFAPPQLSYLFCGMTAEGADVVATLSAPASRVIATESLLSTDGLETGGILLGTCSGNLIEVRHAGGPGPNAQRETHTFNRDLNHAQHLAELAWVEDQSLWIGEWHTHPSADLTPSPLDLDSYLRHLHDPDLNFDQFVAMIVGLDTQARPVIATWLIERHQARPIPLRSARD